MERTVLSIPLDIFQTAIREQRAILTPNFKTLLPPNPAWSYTKHNVFCKTWKVKVQKGPVWKSATQFQKDYSICRYI